MQASFNYCKRLIHGQLFHASLHTASSLVLELDHDFTSSVLRSGLHEQLEIPVEGTPQTSSVLAAKR